MILVAGSANIDFFTRVAHIPAPGETVLGPAFTTAAGGKGANQAVACGRAGGQVAFLGALGDDHYAQVLRDSLQQSGVQDLTITTSTSTGAAFISVSDDGENAITVASGANALLRPEHLPDLAPYQYLVLHLEIPLETVLSYAQAAHKAGVKVILNAAPARALPPELLANVDILVVNEGELATLAGGQGSLTEQLAHLRAQGPSTVLVTLGKAGSLAAAAQGEVRAAAYPVQALDTTGAGDTYVGALAAALDEGQGLQEAMRFASHASALACTRAGAQPAMPTRAEIEATL